MRNQRVHGHVIVHLDPPIDKKKGMVTWGVTVHASGSLCVWLELLGSNQFGTSDKLTVRERIVFYRLLPNCLKKNGGPLFLV